MAKLFSRNDEKSSDDRIILPSYPDIPGHLTREYPFPEQKRPFIAGLETILSNSWAFGLAGASFWAMMKGVELSGSRSIAEFFLSNGASSSDSLPAFLKLGADFLKWSIAPFAACELMRYCMSWGAAAGRDSFFTSSYSQDLKPYKLDFARRAESAIATLNAQFLAFFGRRRDAMSILSEDAQEEAQALSSSLLIHQLLDEAHGKGEKSLEDLISASVSVFGKAESIGKPGRDIFSIAHYDYLRSLRARYTLKMKSSPKSIEPRVSLILLDYIGSDYDSCIAGIDELIGLRTKKAGSDAYGTEKVLQLGSRDFYALCAVMLGSVSRGSIRLRKPAKKRQRWCWEQVYLDAAADPSASMLNLGESKNIVSVVDSEVLKRLILIKEYPDYDSMHGEAMLTDKLARLVRWDLRFILPEQYVGFEFRQGNRPVYVNIMSMLRGRLLSDIISSDDAAEGTIMGIMDFLSLAHSKIDAHDYSLEERDYAGYVAAWSKRAGTRALFTESGLRFAYLPILDSYSKAEKVISLDPHAMNFIITDSGRIAKVDNELSRKCPAQAELAKFFELVPPLRSMAEHPGNPEDRLFRGYLEKYAHGFNINSERKISVDDSFCLCYLDSVIELAVSLYSPYSVRKEMSGMKKNLLLKSLRSIDMISSLFSSHYSTYKDSYLELRRLTNAMVERNGWVY